MPTAEQTLKVHEAGDRLDSYLARNFAGFSRSFWQNMIAQGHVQVNGKAPSRHLKLKAEDLISVKWPEPSWKIGDLKEYILYEDESLIVLDKPPGLLIHPLGVSWLVRSEAALAESEPNLAGLLLKYRPELKDKVNRLGLVHRLDKDTSGVLVAVKTREAQLSLLRQFRKREVKKVYRAVVWGKLKEKKGLIDVPIGRLSHHKKIEVHSMGREAVTEYKVLEEGLNASLLELRPLTGRTNQIRVHLAYLGNPVAGDKEYVGARQSALDSKLPFRMLLHACQLEFTHPKTSKKVTFKAPVPKDFQEAWRQLKGD